MLLKLITIYSINTNSVSQAFINTFSLICPSGNIQYENVLLVVTDEAFKNLKLSLLCHSIHVTCVAHAVHRLCEKIRGQNIEEIKFMSLTKKVLLKFSKFYELRYHFIS